MACKFLKCFFRFLFAMTLIVIAIKGCCELDDNKGFVSQNLRLIGETTSFTSFLTNYRLYCGLIIIVENYLLIFSACLLLLGFKSAKYPGIIAILIELILVHNPFFYGENVHRGVASQYLAVLGGILLF